jgi:dyslexia susceptibility 1 candidate gene 1 protein
VVDEVEPELPAVRTQENKEVKMGFTEKKYAHLPARESQLKEAPYPKSKKMDGTKRDELGYVDVEDKDPVWLKDKGDHFFKRFDYNAAIHAYTKAIKVDEDFIAARLNRATAFIKTRGFVAACDDCSDIIKHVEGLKPEEFANDKDFYDKIMARTLTKRAACNSWLSNFNDAVLDFEKILESEDYKKILGDQEILNIRKDLALIKTRHASNLLKYAGDAKFYAEEFGEALQKYEESVEVDKENEYALGNIGLCHLKRADNQKCIDYSTRALKIIDSFMNETRSFAKQNTLEVKLLLRRSKCYELEGDFEASKADLEKVLLLEPRNTEAAAILKTVQTKLDEITFGKYREEANELLKKKEFQMALDMYEKALKVTRKATTLDNIAVYVNKIACLLSQNKLDRVVSECNEAIRLIRNYYNRFNVKGPDAERLRQMDLRVAVRRGNALGKLGRVEDAVTEYERALKIDPSNATVKRDLKTLQK